MYVYTVKHHIAVFQFQQFMTHEKIRIGYQVMQKSFSDLRVFSINNFNIISKAAHWLQLWVLFLNRHRSFPFLFL